MEADDHHLRDLKQAEAQLQQAQARREQLEKAGKSYQYDADDRARERRMENEVARQEYIRDFGSEGRYTR
jgi:hypothetical protein